MAAVATNLPGEGACSRPSTGRARDRRGAARPAADRRALGRAAGPGSGELPRAARGPQPDRVGGDALHDDDPDQYPGNVDTYTKPDGGMGGRIRPQDIFVLNTRFEGSDTLLP